MAKKVRSARGVMVDFDHLKITQELAATPLTSDVRARQDFIEKRMHRRGIKKSALIPIKHEPVVVSTPVDTPVVAPTTLTLETKQKARTNKK